MGDGLSRVRVNCLPVVFANRELADESIDFRFHARNELLTGFAVELLWEREPGAWEVIASTLATTDVRMGKFSPYGGGEAELSAPSEALGALVGRWPDVRGEIGIKARIRALVDEGRVGGREMVDVWEFLKFATDEPRPGYAADSEPLRVTVL